MDALKGRLRGWGRRLRGLPRGWLAAAISGAVFLILLALVSRAAFRRPPAVRIDEKPFELTAVERTRRGSRAGSNPQPTAGGGAAPAALAEPAHLSGTSQDEISAAWEAAVVERIRRTGRVCVIVHVGLAEPRRTKSGGRSAGLNPAGNAYWGALYGVAGFLPRKGGWTVVAKLNGNGESSAARWLLRTRARGGDAWRARGIDGGFDLYLLAYAWSNSALRGAMDAPGRDALKPRAIRIEIAGEAIDFGAEAVMSGYIGPNGMTKGPWDTFEGLPGRAERPFGVFYLASQSAAYIHEGAVRHGLYSVLFARRPIVPEAYLLDGMLDGLVDGTFGDGFLGGAAREYAKYQRVSVAVARRLLFR